MNLFLNTFDPKIIEKRKELSLNNSKSEITIDLDENIYAKLEELSIKLNVSIEDLILDGFYSFLLNSIEKPADIDEVIDLSTFLVYTDKILNSNKDYLLVDTADFENKSILLTNKDSLLKYEHFKKMT